MDEEDSQDKVFERVSNMGLAVDSQTIHQIVLGQSTLGVCVNRD